MYLKSHHPLERTQEALVNDVHTHGFFGRPTTQHSSRRCAASNRFTSHLPEGTYLSPSSSSLFFTSVFLIAQYALPPMTQCDHYPL